jgi:NAD(P)-dependent dehydrogenase (short-subunit alcohol dehydrogenase family)
MENLDGKVAVITGTANPDGIGFATAAKLADEGCRIVLADLDGDGADARASELRSRGVDAIGVGTDMANAASVFELADRTYDRHGAAHILLLNHVAPTGLLGHGLLNADMDAWLLHVNVNLLGFLHGIKAFVPRMIETGEHAHVLGTTSGAGATGTMYGNGPYTVTKAAITSLWECLYGQLRDAGADVVAGLVFPGVTNTRGGPEVGKMTVDLMRNHGLPAHLMQPEDVAAFTIEGIRSDAFWIHPDVDADARLTGGRHRETIEWEHDIYRRRAEVLINRGDPSDYLWGPPSSMLGP